MYDPNAEEKSLDSMKQEGALTTGAEWAGVAQKVPVVGNFLTPFAAAAGALKGYNDADFEYRDYSRELNASKAEFKQDNIKNAIMNSELSGSSTLPTSDSTQIPNQKEPTQATQTTDQLRSLGLT